MNNKKTLIIIASLLLLGGCAITRVSKEKLNTLTLGLNKNEIEERVGKPSFLIKCNQWQDNQGKTRKIEIPLEIWEYYILKGKNSTLLYIYKNQLAQIEELDRHIYMPDKDKVIDVLDNLPAFKFQIDKEDLEKIRKK